MFSLFLLFWNSTGKSCPFVQSFMCVIYMLFHNCKHSRIRKLSRRNTRNVIKAWWAFWIPLSVQGCAWVKGKPNWKKKTPSKEQLYNIFKVILWSIYSITSCYWFDGWFFLLCLSPASKVQIYSFDCWSWLFSCPGADTCQITTQSTMAHIYCHT